MYHDNLPILHIIPNSRSYLNHFTQPDSIVPDQNNPQAWDRYAYAFNNPVRYNDPTGHCPMCFFVGAMVIGAVVDAGINIYSQSQTGPVDAREVFDHAVEGAVIGGAVPIVAVAATALLPAVPVAASAACADGDCTNEAAAVAQTAENSFPSLEESVEAFKNYAGNNPGKVTILGYGKEIEEFVKGIEGDLNYLNKFDKWSPEFNLDVWLKNAADSDQPIVVISKLAAYSDKFLHEEVARLNEWGRAYIELRK